MPHLHFGRSDDGIQWKFDAHEIEFRCDDEEVRRRDYGYDPRLTRIDGTYYVTWCNGYHGPTIGLARTEDFESFEQLENAVLPYNRNGVLFPRKINGNYALLSRPSDTGHTAFGDIFYSESPDLTYWGRHRHVMGPGPGWWQDKKIGAGPSPIETSEGWLLFYHAVVQTCNGFVYSTGAALLDLEEPWKVLYRTNQAILLPEAPYEVSGFVPNVVFPVTALVDAPTGRIALYCGAADTTPRSPLPGQRVGRLHQGQFPLVERIFQHMVRRFDLAGTWKLRSFDGQRGDPLARLIAGAGSMERAWDAEVPGDVHQALLQHGVIAEPTLGLNSLQCQWIAERLWFYTRTFDAPEHGKNERLWLTFESLDLGAAIYLNGHKVSQHANRFYPFRADVTDYLVPGGNLLVVQVEGGLFHAMHQPADGMGLYIDSELAKRPWLRKVQSSFGWDWAPRLLTVGIPGAVYLEAAAAVHVRQVSCYTELSPDLEQGNLSVRIHATGRQPATVRLRVTIDELQLISEKEHAGAEGEFVISTVIPVPAPDLWWPTGHGTPRLYEAHITLHEGDRLIADVTRKAGFRHIRINQDPHPVRGRYFIVEVNQKPIFLRGANLVPADIIDCRVTPEHTATLVDRALEANFNCLRVWGGGLYESDAFYEICDARGLLVWQEFIFACAKYPATDAAFLADVEKEAAYQVRRLAHHPSLFLWCGNNEMELANAEWASFQSGPKFPDYALFHFTLPRIVREEDPSRFYLPSSPFSPDGLPPNDPDSGDQHPWSVGFAETDFRLYREMTCRFPNEGGFLGPTALPTMLASLAGRGIGSFAWEHHENAVSYWGDRCAPDAMLEQWLGLSIGEMTVEDYVFHAGLLQGEALAEYIKNFRRRKFDSAAAIFWMFNDAWPTVRSWVIVDYYLRRTPSFHPVRRAFAPLTVVVAREGSRVCVYGVNDGPHWNGHLRFGICALAGDYPLSEQIEVTVPSNASVCLAEFEYEEWEKLGTRDHLAFALLLDEEGVVAQDRLILPWFKEMPWPPNPSIQIEWNGRTATFTSEVFAWNVCLDLDGEKALPDNFFDLLPGVPRNLPWPANLGAPVIVRVGNGRLGTVFQRTAV